MIATTPSLSVVTGAARGIGLQTVRQLLAQGDHVALIDIDEPELLKVQAQFEQSAPGRTSAWSADIADDQAVARIFSALGNQHGSISSLVNNAGIAVFKPIGETSTTEFARVMAVNLNGAFICSQAAVPWMLKAATLGHRPVAIVNICSISGLRASTLRVAYGTSKAALMHLTRQQAVELGAQGIRVNGIAPGPVDTAMARAVHSPQIRADYVSNIPLARYGEESEIADAICYLLSSKASYVNGQILAADGGFDAAGIGLKDL